MKKILAIILIILILGVGGYFLFDYLSKPKMLSFKSEPVSTCADTDGNNIYEEGYSDYTLSDGTKMGMGDVCDFSPPLSETNVGVVREGYCDGNNLKIEWWSCGKDYICRRGECIKQDSSYPMCSDNDGGINEKLMGSVVDDTGSSDDSCWTSINKQDPESEGEYSLDCSNSAEIGCYVYEYYCDNYIGPKQHEIIACQKGCLNGACQ